MSEKYRLVTRSDFDGLVCAMILKEKGMLESIKFVHPKDMQDGKISVTDHDITTNLPFVPGVHLAFDHHSSESEAGIADPAYIIDPQAPSAAHVVYHYFGGSADLPRITSEIMQAVDKCDSAQFSMEDILHPQGWNLMGFLMDARTGLGRFHDFRISNYDLMMELIDYCLDHTVDEVLELPDVKERVDLYFAQQEQFKAQLQRVHYMDGKVVVIPLKEEEIIYTGNRFLIYALYPEAEISVHVMWGFQKQNTAVTIGKSIVNRSSQFDIGELCHRYGGGGHHNAGTCQLPNDTVDELLPKILDELNGR